MWSTYCALIVILLNGNSECNAFISPAATSPCITPIQSMKLPIRKTTITPSTTTTTRIQKIYASSSIDGDSPESKKINHHEGNGPFDLTTALFCGGLAFDAYASPPEDSSRWERGSSGVDVAFQSTAFTRSIYKGLLQVQPIKCSDLPDEDNSAEGLMTGSGVDAYLLVAVAEGKWKEDIDIIEKDKYNDGVLALQGCAHVGRSSTAWSNIDEKKAAKNLKEGKGGSYHVKSSWAKGGQAIWNDKPFYLYVQEPREARLVFTVMDDNVVGAGKAIGSTSRRLVDILPAAKVDDPIAFVKEQVIVKLKQGEKVDINDTESLLNSISQEWQESMKLTSKPRTKDKKGQIAVAAAAGAMVAGPVGAAVGGILGNVYESEPRGRVEVKVKYMPIPEAPLKREKYVVRGGLPGVNWADLHNKHLRNVRLSLPEGASTTNLAADDLEFCCFVSHDTTGCSCAIYRSLDLKMIAISFRGTCELVDLVTDASLIQEAWVQGEEIDKEGAMKVHVGFRKSLNSIAKKLKELVLSSVAPGDNISDYDLIITGHSLGGALSTLFTADIAEYGIDAGRGLPQSEASEPWWNSLASNFFKEKEAPTIKTPPPRPKSIKMYNFGSPRVGNAEFVANFNSLLGNGIDEAYRIVNGEDVVARLPRTVNALNFVSIGYDHCGPTVLISIPEEAETNQARVWIEGQSEGTCPVRDGQFLSSNKGIVGIDQKFVQRESKIIQSIFNGDAISHHMEDQYYMAMGRACGFEARVGEEIKEVTIEKPDLER
jgi:hypothetical protein